MANMIFPFDSNITCIQRTQAMMQTPRLIWLTGLSGSGKTTLALRLEHYFFSKGFKVFILDGDNVRNGLCKDLGFSEADRKENLRRVAEVATLMLDAGLIVISAFISPNGEDRQAIKNIVGEQRFIEVYVNCAVEVCEKRDVKGLYAKARKGIIPNFTGVSAPYESPLSPDVEVRTAGESIEESVLKIIKLVEPAISLKLNVI
ncbi:MAG: adenylyl-sulfate kinase [Bacteroidota bacterium]|nr:adenylyl-sulfate kinase [Bacteroidota bacterium]